MNIHGDWKAYCFLPETIALPSQLKVDLEKWQQRQDTEFSAVSEKVFARAMSELLEQILALDSFYGNSYHNFSTHFASMVDRTSLLLQKSKYPRAVEQAMMMAALGHDIAHPGSSHRADSCKPLYFPDLGVMVSNEWVSGLITDTCAVKNGFGVGARLCTFSAIIATTFGDPNFKLPNHPLAQLIAIADIVPSGDLLEWIEQGFCVLQEMPTEKRPSSYDGWLMGRKKFLTYINSRMTRDAWSLWGSNFTRIEQGIESLTLKTNPFLSAVVERRVTTALASWRS